MRSAMGMAIVASFAVALTAAATAAPVAPGHAVAPLPLEQVQYGGGGYSGGGYSGGGGGYSNGYKGGYKKRYCRNVKVCRDSYYGPKCHWEKVCD